MPRHLRSTENGTMAGSEAAKHWDQCWEHFDVVKLDPQRFLDSLDASDRSLFERIGNVQDKEILEIGCGNGFFSVYLAKRGAYVTAIDTSEVATQNTMKLAAANGVESRVRVHTMNALELKTFGSDFDLVFGKYILHHIEPFDEFSATLSRLVRETGRAVFLENNARSPLLMFFRKNVVGKYGVPKFGDDQEYPFEPREIDLLRRHFHGVEIHHPELVFFGLASEYLFRNRGFLARFCRGVDCWFYEHVPAFNCYSYRQIVELQKS